MEYKIVGISELESEYNLFELSGILYGKGKFVILYREGEEDWFPMAGRNRYENKTFAEQAIEERRVDMRSI